ncbi:MAG: nuclear transport factor 2 family protein [Acidobacteriota bacterium]|nr:nuclear transport factor 2 family protein [Acidobacteriota bacterium]
MDRQDIARRYLDYLSAGALENLLTLFAPDAVVHSPLYGTLPASRFYPDLLAATRSSELTYQTTYIDPTDPLAAALAFTYRWTLATGEVRSFQCVDLLRFDETGRIAELTIIYDTAGAPKPEK